MNLDPLNRAARLAEQLQTAICDAHTEACHHGARCEEALIFELIAPAVRLHQTTERAALCAAEDAAQKKPRRARRSP